jgi:tetratricopeptide (TPR) repeat protein
MNKFRFPLPFYFVLLVLYSGLPLFSQEDEAKLKEAFLEAESYFLFEEYKDALPLYQRILNADPENYSLQFKVGVCYLNDLYQKHKSIQYLEKAVKGTSPDYKQNNFKERMAPLEAYYYLGNAYRVNNRLNEAIEAYTKFKQVLDPVVYDAELVDEQIKACKVAADLQSRPTYYIAVNLGEPINSRFEDINPVISGDETTMAFTRKLQFYDAVFYAQKKNGKWTEPVNLTPFFMVDGNTYCTGLSYDGREMFVYRLDGFDGNLYVSKREGDDWSKLVKLNDNINTKYWESHASLSKDGKTLYFTSNRKEGYGGLDIYKSERKRGDEWGPAINLGPVINSKYNEETPFLSEDGKTLFFSSLGHYNMGDYDIFYSSRLDNGQWATPVNMGYPLNTTGDDLFFTPVKNGEYAYYSTYDAAEGLGLCDIYKMEVFSDLHPRKFILNGITRIEDDLKVDFSKITVSLIDRKSKTLADKSPVSPDGNFTLNATSGDFDLVFEGEGIQKTSENITIPINNPSHIISYTSPLIAPGLTAVVKTDEPLQPVRDNELPTLISNFDKLDVTTGDPIPIKLELERNSKLKIETYLNGALKNTEEFDINRRKFIYLFKPEPGNNLLKLTLTSEQGTINSREIEVNYVPGPDETAVVQQTTVASDALDGFYKSLLGLSRGNLKDFLGKLNLDSLGLTSAIDLYNYLISQASANGYGIDEVDNLFIKILSGKDVSLFRDELINTASGNVRTALDTLDLQEQNIVDPSALLDHLYGSVSGSSYSRSDLRQLLTATLTSGNADATRFIKMLRGFGSDTLKSILSGLDPSAAGISQPGRLIDYLLQVHPSLENDLDAALMQAAASLDLVFLYQGLILLSQDSLKNTLIRLNLDKEKISNSLQLIDYLWKKSATNGFTKEELINHIERIKKDPYSIVEMFRKLLSSRATGTLKTVIDELDIRSMHINTIEELLNYLIRQSEFNDYNRENVYSLLLDIIDPRSLDDFLAALKRHAGQPILDALATMDENLYSTPLEVIRYLISVSNDHGYTERDVLNLLLKLVIEKGLGSEEPASGSGFLRFFREPGIARNLIIVNGIIILIIIFLVFRKKSKKE